MVDEFDSFILGGVRRSAAERYEVLRWERSRAGILVSGVEDYLLTIDPRSGDGVYKAQVSDKRLGYRVLMSAFYSTEEDAKEGIKSYFVKHGRR